MKQLKRTIAIAACRFLYGIVRMAGFGGSAFPGSVANKIDSHLLAELAKNVQVVLIAGTNGKSTITHLIDRCAAEGGLHAFANLSGANLKSGVITSFVLNSNLRGVCRQQYAFIECDEFALAALAQELRPVGILVNNIFEDQLDRYGDMTAVLQNLISGIQSAPDARLYINCDCSYSVAIAQAVPNPKVYYGCNLTLNPAPQHNSFFCRSCGTKLQYEFHVLGHLGAFYCPCCGKRRPAPDYCITWADCREDGSSLCITAPDKEIALQVQLPGAHQVYNALAAYVLAVAAGIDSARACKAIGAVKNIDWRTEKIGIGDCRIQILLTKNPVGVACGIHTLTQTSGRIFVLLGLNDEAPDGTDVSWIWDAPYEMLSGLLDRTDSIYVCGSRAAALRMRLKYAGIPAGKIQMAEDDRRLIRQLAKKTGNVYLLGNYTYTYKIRALLRAQQACTKNVHKRRARKACTKNVHEKRARKKFCYEV